MHAEVRKGRDLLGMPVYTVEEGKRLGEVTALLVRPSDSTVAAIRFTSGGSTYHLAFERFRTVGHDALLIDNEAVLHHDLSSDQCRELDTGLSGRPVITMSGQRLGTLLGFQVETSTGRIEAYRVKPESGMLARLAASVMDRGLEIPISQVHSLGAHALIVHDDAATAADAVAPPDEEPLPHP